jgi:hypothetical protein
MASGATFVKVPIFNLIFTWIFGRPHWAGTVNHPPTEQDSGWFLPSPTNLATGLQWSSHHPLHYYNYYIIPQWWVSAHILHSGILLQNS